MVNLMRTAELGKAASANRPLRLQGQASRNLVDIATRFVRAWAPGIFGPNGSSTTASLVGVAQGSGEVPPRDGGEVQMDEEAPDGWAQEINNHLHDEGEEGFLPQLRDDLQRRCLPQTQPKGQHPMARGLTNPTAKKSCPTNY